MIKYILSSLLFVVSFAVTAQTDHIHNERCGHALLMNAMENQFPGYRDALQTTFRKAKENVSITRTDDVYRIPVVVHVVWNEAEENIPDAQILDQIEVLNEDFRALNSDLPNLRSEFTDISGDALIEFDLVAIERVQTTETFGLEIDFTTFEASFSDDKLKDTASGGSTPYDTNTHLNIWVCNIQPLEFFGQQLGQILGLAYPPVDIADFPDLNNFPPGQFPTDPQYNGVIIHYPAFGGRNRNFTIPNLGPVTFEGRTTVHEVGHYLGLRHTWGDPAQNPLTGEGEDGCLVDDGMADTPNAASNSQQTGCVASKNTCIDNMNDLPDMWENYMDYSVEACQVSFTQDQIDLMRGILEGPRSDLYEIGSVANDEIETLKRSINISPNPTSGNVSLTIKGEGNDDYQITVRNILGGEVMNPTSSSGNNVVDLNLSDLSNGVYFIEIQKGNVRAAKKVVLAK